MKRILIIGSGGAGKSTVARELGAILGLPVIHLDQLYWKAGWEAPAKGDWVKTVDDVIAHPEWILDGNFGGTLPRRIKRADTVIMLDIPRFVCLWRVVRRFAKYRGQDRPDMTAGCPERVTWEFVRWIWNYPKKSKPAKLALLQATKPDQRVVILSSSREIRSFMAETRRETELRALSAALASKR